MLKPLGRPVPHAVAALLCLLLTCAAVANDTTQHLASTGQPETLSYELLETLPHNPNWFTQGLLMEGEWLYESAGRYRHSEIIQYNAKNNQIKNNLKLHFRLFAEGLTLLNDTFYLLTWQNNQLLTFDRNLTPLKTIAYDGEGWGLTHNGKQLIMSDGSANLLFRNAETFAIEKTITAHSLHQRGQQWRQQTWPKLNELEYVGGIIWANQWQTQQILAIDANTGRVLATLPLEPITQQHTQDNNSVLNGIAYAQEHHAFWITGKFWDKRYLIRPSGLLPD